MDRLGRLIGCAVLLILIFISAPPVNAQGVGGNIIGTVSDQTGAVVPGVTLTVAGPALMGTRTEVTDGEGKYRFANLPPGSNYTVTYELPGFAMLKREGIRLDVGFTATINVTMSTASLQESVTVTGASPVVDATASKVATHFDADQIKTALVGSRDYAAVMSVMPGVVQSNTDVGGSSATTMQGFRAYGMTGGRGEIEGINSTMFGSGGLVGYSDMEAFGDMAVSLAGNSAETPAAGAFISVVSKTGGNAYHGGAYADYEPQGFSSTNIDQALINRGLSVGLAAEGKALDVHDLNKFKLERDLNGNMGGFLIKDKLWWFGSVRHTTLSRFLPTVIDGLSITNMPALTGKITYNVTQNHKVAVFESYTRKLFENYNASTTRIQTADTLTDEKYPNATKGVSYDAVLSSQMVLTLRAGHWGDFGDYGGKGQSQRYDDSGTTRLYGSRPGTYDIRDRPQANGSLSIYKTGWVGDHGFKIGGEFQHEQQKAESQTFGPANTILYMTNNVPTQIDIYLVPNATRAVGRSKSIFFSDQWRINQRATVNLGYRFDQHTGYVPAQVGPQGHQFPQINAPTFNVQAPRLGIAYSLSKNDQKTLVKASWGIYWETPGYPLASSGNPNPNSNFTRYEWIDPTPIYNAQGLPIYEGPQQLGRVISSSGARPDFSPSTTYDPNLKDQYTPSASVYFEREVAANFGVRTGFVWNGLRNQRSTVNINQPFEAYTVPVTVPNPGPDGLVGSADDGPAIAAYNLDPTILAKALPVVNVLQNGYALDNDYYTWEVTGTRRMSNHWSLLASFSNMWSKDGVTRNTPNSLINTTDGRNDYSEWEFRLQSGLQLPHGINLTPIVRAQQGRPYSPTFTTRLNYNSSVTINAAPIGDQKNDNVAVFDIRAAKDLKFGGTKLQGFVDVYNIFNSNAVQVMITTYGANFRRPGTITGPRIARVGFRYEF